MKKKSVRQALGQYIGISVSVTLATLGVVALRHAWETPQPLKSSLPGEALLYSWRQSSVFYKVLGPASAPPLVLFHSPGIGSSAQKMQQLMAPLAQNYRVYAPDLLGFGLSDRPAMRYSARMYTELCQDFLRDVVREPATLVASELSCNYMVAVASDTPELCSSLVLISPIALQIDQQPVPLQAYAEQPVVKALLYPLLSTRLAFLLMQRYRRSNQADFAQFRATTHQFGAEHASMALLAGRLRENAAQQFETLHQPVLLIWGTQALEDNHNLAILRRSTQNHQARRVELIAEAGLAVQEEHPDSVIAAMQHWQVELASLLSAPGENHTQTSLASSQPTEMQQKTPDLIDEADEDIPVFIELEPSSAPQMELEENISPPDKKSPEEEAQPARSNSAKPATILAYCFKCKKKTEMQNASEFLMKNGRRAVRGSCSICRSSITRIGGLSETRQVP